jgi:hypothetical protein
MLGVRAGAIHRWAAGVQDALGVVAPPWPLVALAWSASSVALSQAALAEALLVGASVALPALGSMLQRALRRAGVAAIAATWLGAALAAALWAASGSALMPFAR